MKEFAIGTVTIAVACAVVTGILMVMEPVGPWAEQASGKIGKWPAPYTGSYAPASVAVFFTMTLILGVCSKGIGAGVLNEMKLRAKHMPTPGRSVPFRRRESDIQKEAS